MARKKPLCAFLTLCLSAADERLTARSRKEKGGPPDVKKYTLKRILTSLFTLLAILLVLFILMQLHPHYSLSYNNRVYFHNPIL